MDQERTTRLTAMMASIQKQWGTAALQPLSCMTSKPVLAGIPTGFALLDAVLGASGIPCGQTTELLGRPTSGMTTLAYRIVAAAQQQNQYALYVDVESVFNPTYAVQCGIQLNQLFLARPETELDALDIARDLIEKGSVGAIVLDLGQSLPNIHHLRRLATLLSHSGCVVLLLIALADGASPQSIMSGSPAALRLILERDSWLQRDVDVYGYRTQVTVWGRHQASGKRVSIDIDINQTGDAP